MESGISTFDQIQQVHTKLNAIAASVPTMLGGGLYGCLLLTLTNDTYQTFTRQVADHPDDSGEASPEPNNPSKMTHEQDK
eukprot:3420565-Ditylum_brightwellii.AAC.1